MKDTSQILKSLGLVDSEVKTYLQALEQGPSTVLDLAKGSGISRQATYLAIESLTKRGLISSVLRGKKNFYAAESPDKLLAYAERYKQEVLDRVEDLRNVVPQLALQSGGEKPVVKVFEGKEGVRALLDETRLSKPKHVDEITDVKSMLQAVSLEDLQPYRDQLTKLQTTFRGIYNDGQYKADPKNQYLRLGDAEGNFHAHVGVFGDKVVLATFEGKMHSILIESKAIAAAMKKLFDLSFKK